MIAGNTSVIGIDLGGTNIRAGLLEGDSLTNILSESINSEGNKQEVLDQVFSITDLLFNKNVTAIGIGVPGLIDAEQQLVFDVINIPSWNEVPLQQWMQDRYQVPVFINNDANCFALGEYYFGKGKAKESMVGLSIGTGLGAGIIINNKLHAGHNYGAGEFGMVDYLEHNYEYYASGQFFKNVHNVTGKEVFELALNGNQAALTMFDEFGFHLGNAIKMILYTYDPSCIILGGSVSRAFSFFRQAMWQQIKTFAYQRSLTKLTIEVSELEHCGVLGAAALALNEK